MSNTSYIMLIFTKIIYCMYLKKNYFIHVDILKMLFIGSINNFVKITYEKGPQNNATLVPHLKTPLPIASVT